MLADLDVVLLLSYGYLLCAPILITLSANARGSINNMAIKVTNCKDLFGMHGGVVVAGRKKNSPSRKISLGFC